MRNLGFIVCLFCLSIAGFAQASGHQSKPLSPLEQTLIANTNAVPEAQKSRNVDFLKRTLTDDFVSVGSEGKLHDKEEMVGPARMMANSRIFTLTICAWCQSTTRRPSSLTTASFTCLRATHRAWRPAISIFPTCG